MKIIAVAITGLIASTFFFYTAWASTKKSSSKSLDNVVVSKSFEANSLENEVLKKEPKVKATSVKPHFRSPRNKSKLDNWSTIGNVNPYTGKKGTKRP